MIPRPPKSSNRREVPVGNCPAVCATVAASVAPHYLAVARASMRGLAHRRDAPANAKHSSQSPSFCKPSYGRVSGIVARGVADCIP
eukprot:4650837-Pyramimonas_sp.AAC.1